MVDARAKIGLGIAAAGLIVLCASLSKINDSPVAYSSSGDSLHPIAALAWAQARCDSQMSLRTGTPRLQRDNLLEMSATLDEIEQRQGLTTACKKAEARAAAVAQTGNSTTPTRNTALARDPQSR
jgi:hypothetical protein